jgi:hypothetical protein
MSPLVQRRRAAAPRQPDPTDEHWSMLMFESCSAGVMAVAAGLGAVLLVVCFYCVIVWPLTFWDLADLGLEKYGSLVDTVLWSVFAGGALAGYWCFSGAAFKSQTKRKPAQDARTARTKR